MLYDPYFLKVAEPIVTHPEYVRLKLIKHHTTTRYEHAVFVALLSYRIAKVLRLDWDSVIRGALLHDFFHDDSKHENLWIQCKQFVTHPKRAGLKANELFELNKKEWDIITKHMFPATPGMPLCREAWLVNIIDSWLCLYEYFKMKESKRAQVSI